MKQFENHLIGVDQGEIVLFSDFENGGEMWTGTGPRERRQRVVFNREFRELPMVHVSVSLWDVDTSSAVRAEISAENIACDGFDIVFRTWLDTRVARIRAAWLALGSLPHADDWDIS
jgi:H-type lectin domain